MECLTPGVEYNSSTHKVTLSDVTYPITIKVNVKKREMFSFSIVSDGGGTVSSDCGDKVEGGDTVKISAAAEEGYEFVGYSVGKSLRDGGMYFSSSADETYTVNGNTELYANFVSPEDFVIMYDLSGGYALGSEMTKYCQISSEDFHLCPNTLPDTGIFVREGYVLAGYTDIAGKFYGCGWNIVMPEGNRAELSAVWLKETPAERFTYTVSGSGVTLTGYDDGGADIVVIPETISGEKVTAIAEGTFSGAEFEEIFISRNITTIADGAVKSCGLKVCRLNDSVVNISDCAFADCDDFSTLIINAVRTPTCQNTQHGSYAVKYERLMTSRSPKLIITSGSSSAYGFLSEQFIGEISEAGCGDWDVVNYACHYQTPGVFYIDVISNFISAGDVVLHSPEPLAAQLGSVKITPVMWQFFEGAYEAFSLVDIREYELLFDSFAEFNQTRAYMPETSYSDHWEGVNVYGDVDFYKRGQYDGFVGGQGLFSFNPDLISSDNLNRVYDKVTEHGGYVLMTFAPVNSGAVLPPSKDRKNQLKYMDAIEENLHVTLISDVEDQVWNGKYMFDTNLHLSTEGASLRTSKLSRDFAAWFKEHNERSE